MDLLSVARGPALHYALFIFLFGVLWRLVGVSLLAAKPDYSEPRRPASWKGLRMIVLRFWPRREFAARSAMTSALGYVFHAGLFIVFFFCLPHVLFLEDLFKPLFGGNLTRLTGLSWPYLSGGLIMMSAAVTVAALVALLVHRIASPVKRLISNFDDYFSWLVTTIPLLTGMLASAHLGAPYQTLLALHILSVDLLLVWFPFGKLMHSFTIFVVRGISGMSYERKGAAL
jgi:nitrate reductase gamma subunit